MTDLFLPSGALPAPVVTRLAIAGGGATWRKIALQVNPFSYRLAHGRRTSAAIEDKSSYNKALVEALVTNQVDAIAVTGHDGDTPDARSLAAEAEGAGISAFPGVEVECDGVHVLCLFDPAAGFDAVRSFHNWYERERAEHTCTLFSLMEHGATKDFLAVPAHVDAERKGLLSKMQGQQAEGVLTSSHLHAIATYTGLAQLSHGYRDRLKAADARRDTPLAVLAAVDVSDPVDVDKPNATSWLRLDDLNLEGLRCAVTDPDSRVVAHAALTAPHLRVRAVTWEGGYLDGVTCGLSDGLTVLIGGRGAGKSTVLESIRFVTGELPLTDLARQRYQQLVTGALGEGTRVSLLVEEPSGKTVILSRTVARAPECFDGDGRPLSGGPVPRIEVYGQHELADLAMDEPGRLGLLTRFVDPRPDIDRSIEQAQAEARSLGTRLLRAQEQRDGLEEELSRIPELQDRLRRLQESGIHDAAARHAAIEKEEQWFAGARRRIEDLGELFEAMDPTAPARHEQLDQAVFAVTPSADLLGSVAATLDRLAAAAGTAASSLEDALGRARSELAGIEEQWGQQRGEAREAYEALLRELQEPEGAQAFVHVQTELDRLQGRRSLLAAAEAEVAASRTERQKSLTRLRKAQDTRTAYYEAARDRAHKAVGHDVRVTVHPAGDRRKLLEELRRLGGRMAEAIDAFGNTSEDLMVDELVASARQGAAALAGRYGVPPAQAERIVAVGEEAFCRWEAIDLGPTVEIALDVAAAGHPPAYRLVGGDLSTGQNATAMLRLLLAGGTAPMVIDQPEDDLDSDFVHRQVVADLRREKRVRQIVCSSHNPNIPVLGDAEQVLVLEPDPARSGKGRLRTSGSLERPEVRAAAAEILEGGAQALRRRFRRYRLDADGAPP